MNERSNGLRIQPSTSFPRISPFSPISCRAPWRAGPITGRSLFSPTAALKACSSPPRRAMWFARPSGAAWARRFLLDGFCKTFETDARACAGGRPFAPITFHRGMLMKIRSRFFTLLLLSFSLTSSALAAQATPLKIGHNAFADESVLYLGRDAGIFNKHGIDLELIYIP